MTTLDSAECCDGKIRGRNLGREISAKPLRQEGTASRPLRQALMREGEGTEAARIQDTKALAGLEVSLDFILCGQFPNSPGG